jgi:hypothetical protein
LINQAHHDQAPEYKTGIYESSPNCVPEPYERFCFPFVLNERKHFSIRERIQKMPGVPKSAKLNDANMISWITKKIAIPDGMNMKIHPSIDVAYICKYIPKYGYKFAIDSGTNLYSTKNFTIAVTSSSKSPYILQCSIPV